MDSLIITLFWLKTGQKLNVVSKIFKMSNENITHKTIKRVKEPLLLYLKDKWWSNRIRPIQVADIPDVALIGDSTSVRVSFYYTESNLSFTDL